MRFELAEIAHHKGYRRQVTEFRAIAPTKLLGEELARIYLANVMLWRAAVPRIIEQYRSSVASMRTDRAPALQSEIEHAQSTVESHKARNTAIVAAFLLRFEQWHRGQWIVIVKRTTVDLTHFIGAQDMAAVLETALARNAALISDISNEAAGKISDIVFRGLQNKTPVTQIASELQQVVGFARKRSIRVAHDQTIKLSSALDAARMAQAGVAEFVWKHTPQPHPRLHHLARHGLVFKLGQPRGDEPGEAPFCRCYRMPIMRLPTK